MADKGHDKIVKLKSNVEEDSEWTSLTDEEVTQINAQANCLSYKAGEIIFMQDDD